MTTLAPSAVPPNAIPIWSDGLNLWTELPGPFGPVVLRYPLTSAGLSQALGLIRTRTFDTAAPAPTPPKRRPLAQDLAADAALRKAGILR